MEAWGHAGMLEVVLGQLVNLLRDGEPVRMSKRTGEMVTFEELVDEVGVDATRYLMLSRSSDQMIDFDIEVAKKQDATNPGVLRAVRPCAHLLGAAQGRRRGARGGGQLGMDEREVRAVGEGRPFASDRPSEAALARKLSSSPSS